MAEGALATEPRSGRKSPRWNTHKMLEAVKAGAEEAGAVTELVDLYDIKFPGCKSCFAYGMHKSINPY